MSRPPASVPVILVHGFASSFERNWGEAGWADLLREEGRTVIGVDLLGHGSAAKPAEPAAYAELEQSILAALPGAGQSDAVGFSMGAQLAAARRRVVARPLPPDRAGRGRRQRVRGGRSGAGGPGDRGGPG